MTAASHQDRSQVTVNIKLYGKREGLLDLTTDADTDFYLVMCGPKGAAASSRGAIRPFVIETVHLFEARPLLAALGERGVKIGTATSVATQYWDAAEIFPRASNRRLTLDAQQRPRSARSLLSESAKGGLAIATRSATVARVLAL
jgi:hypothetical protein